MNAKAINTKYLYSELSHEIIGAAFSVQNQLGPGRPEKTYQKAMARDIYLRKIKFKEQVSVDLIYKGVKVGTRRLDLVVDSKIVVELKVGNHISREDYVQLREYLQMSGLRLGLIILFTSHSVVVKRVPNVL